MHYSTFTTPGNFKPFTIGKFIFTGLPIWEKRGNKITGCGEMKEMWNFDQSALNIYILYAYHVICGILANSTAICFFCFDKNSAHIASRVLGLADFSYILTKYLSFREVIWFSNLNSYFDRYIFERMLWVSWILCFRSDKQSVD